MPERTETAIDKCAAGTLRRAARSISRVYDARLAGTGLTTMQFSLLRAIERHGEFVALTVLATELVFERTSLYRSLEPLRRDGLIAFRDGTARAKQVTLTAEGARRIAKAMPLWLAAQEEFLGKFGRAPWNAMAAHLVEIVDVARQMDV